MPLPDPTTDSSGLLAQPKAGDNALPFTVSELSGALKRTVEGAFGHVRVRGEISGWKRHASGHCYMTLKDADACMDAVLWRGQAASLAFRPEDGAEVIASGKLTTYPGRSKYQLVVDRLELAGEGALMALLDKRRRALAAEGLFDAERKRPLPFLPRTIGIVTSPTGAVIRDILHRLADRCPTRVIVWPVPVQGEGAAAKVAAAIEGFGALTGADRPDLLIVARGGGSIEDLWAFNEEEVVRAAASSPIPLISAVGHETDTTLIDHAADRRAPTPTAAAEMAVPVRAGAARPARRAVGAQPPLPLARRRSGARAARADRVPLPRPGQSVRAPAPAGRRDRRPAAPRAGGARGPGPRRPRRGRAAPAPLARRPADRTRRGAARGAVADGAAGASRPSAVARLCAGDPPQRGYADHRRMPRARQQRSIFTSPMARSRCRSMGAAPAAAAPVRLERKRSRPYVAGQAGLFDLED